MYNDDDKDNNSNENATFGKCVFKYEPKRKSGQGKISNNKQQAVKKRGWKAS